MVDVAAAGEFTLRNKLRELPDGRHSPAGDLQRIAHRLRCCVALKSVEAGTEIERALGREIVAAKFFTEAVKCVAVEEPGIGLIFPDDVINFTVDGGAFFAIEFMATLDEELINPFVRILGVSCGLRRFQKYLTSSRDRCRNPNRPSRHRICDAATES